MSSSSEQVIHQAVQNRYQNSEKTKSETLTTIKHYKCLVPKLRKFVFNDGTEKDLLNLDGTIPVRYKGSTYNIPVSIWLLDNHPYSSPMVYVKPTNDMLIKASRHVDQSGKVYLPYLHEWNPNSSDLMGLIQIMIMTFAEVPPVYSKPRNSGNSPAHYPTPYPSQPSTYMPVAAPGSQLPYPVMPPSTQSGGYPPYPNNPASQPPYPVMPPNMTPYPSAQPPPPYPTSGPTPYPTYPPVSATFTQSSGETNTISSGTIKEEHIRASLISAASHLVREKLRDSYGTAQAEVSVLRQQQTDLNQGKTKLESLLQKLTHEQDELDKSIHHLHEKEAEMKSVLSKLGDEAEPLDIDEAVTTTAPLYKQLINAYAEDQATQDAIYYLGESLRRDVIDLDSYLKHVRSLSRRQFQLRATMNKCRAKANLPG